MNYIKIFILFFSINLSAQNQYDSTFINEQFYIETNYAYYLYSIGKISNSINCKLELLERVLQKQDTLKVQETLFWLGFYNRKKNNIDKAKYFFIQSLEYNIDISLWRKSCFQLGLIYRYLNDYKTSVDYYELVINSLENTNNLKEKRLLLDAYFNISTNYFSINKITNSIRYSLKADSISRLIATPKHIQYLIKKRLGNLFNQYYNLDIEKASNYYYQALEIKKNKDEIYILLANLYNTTNFKKSLFFLNRAQKNIETTRVYGRRLFFNYGLTYYHNKKYKTSLANFKKSIFVEINGGVDKIISKEFIINYTNKRYLLKVFPYMADANLKLYNITGDKEYLDKSLKYFEMSDYIIELLKINSSKLKSKLFWRQQSANLYGNAIKACFLAKDLEKAFYFMEKNKALVLMEDIATQNYKLSLDISKEALKKEADLKKKIIQLDITNYINKDSVAKLKLDYQRELEIFQDSIYKGKKVKKEISISSLKEVQDSLSSKEVLVSYYTTKSKTFNLNDTNSGFAFFITKDTVLLKEIELSSLAKKIKKYDTFLKQPLETKSALRDYQECGYDLYKILFPSIFVRKIINQKKVYISADNMLSFLPFESLLTLKKSTDILLKNAEISYVYSWSFQQENKKINRKSTKDFFGIAPIQFIYDSLPNLPESKKEVERVQSLFYGKSFYQDSATKQNFINLSKNYSILHLATHADANISEIPWIAFSDKKLYLPELQTLKTNADLVVLSACNTSLGEIANGEGVLSLTRGFFYSGANTVVSSLWNVNDQVTKNIMYDFYKELKEGKTKSSALRHAKLKYLDTHSGSELSPYYWSSFVLMGDSGVLTTVSNYNWIYYGIAFFVLILFVWYIFKTRYKLNKK